jgi:hypothetical protein
MTDKPVPVASAPDRKKVRLLKKVTGDFPFGHDCFVEAGIHEVAHENPYGAISVRDNKGGLLGIKPGEFEWVASAPSSEGEPAPKWKNDADREFLRAAMMKHFSDKLSMDEIGDFIYDVVPEVAPRVQETQPDFCVCDYRPRRACVVHPKWAMDAAHIIGSENLLAEDNLASVQRVAEICADYAAIDRAARAPEGQKGKE